MSQLDLQLLENWKLYLQRNKRVLRFFCRQIKVYVKNSTLAWKAAVKREKPPNKQKASAYLVCSLILPCKSRARTLSFQFQISFGLSERLPNIHNRIHHRIMFLKRDKTYSYILLSFPEVSKASSESTS